MGDVTEIDMDPSPLQKTVDQPPDDDILSTHTSIAITACGEL